jgi:uncharacterized surface protein with fasciclin (FAS1) repeats
MKKAVFVILFLSGSLFSLAQRPDSVVNKTAKTRNAGGVQMSSAKSIIDNIAHAPEFSTFNRMIDSAGLKENLGSGNITIFVPVNKAFDKLAPGKLDTLLLSAHRTELVSLVNDHIVSGRITAKDIAAQIKAGNGQATLTTLSGGTLTARINENRNIVLTDASGEQSIVTQFDIGQSNGILHVINGVLMPKVSQ